jgi:hypothetical protein
MAQHEQGQVGGQLAPEPTVVTQRPPRPSPGQTSIASHSQSGSKRTTWEERTKWAKLVDANEISAWGLSIAHGANKAQVLREVNSRYGTSEGTAGNWFSAIYKDGLTPTGRSLLKSSASQNPIGAGLSEAQFHQLGEAIRSGDKSIRESLASIGRADISNETVRFWFDPSTKTGLTSRGRNVLLRIQANAYIDGP